MGRKKIFKEGKEEVAGYLHPTEFESFEEIRWRERKGKTEIVRQAILEYISGHKEGNSTFKLDNWNENSDFKAVPTVMSRPEIWYEYLNDCTPEERLDIQKKVWKIHNQCLALK